METNPVTVVVTTCNYGHFLPECLESVFAQSWQDFEIVLVDDGSTDGTAGIVERYLDDPRIRFIRQENGGQARAKNTGIRNARGELIAFLDADDRWHPTKLEKQLRLFAADTPRLGVTFTQARRIDQEGRPLAASRPGRYLLPRSGEVARHLFLDNFVPFSSSMVRKECFTAHGCFDESLQMGIDWDLWLRISTGYRFAFVDEPLLDYRVGHAGQMSKNKEVRHACSDRIMARFLENNPGLLPPSVIRRAQAYTFCNRGHYYRRSDPVTARGYYLKALAARPLEFSACKGLLRSLLAAR